MIPLIKMPKTCNVHYNIRSKEVLGEITKGASGLLVVFSLFLSEFLIHNYVHFGKIHQAIYVFVLFYIANAYFNEMLF